MESQIINFIDFIRYINNYDLKITSSNVYKKILNLGTNLTDMHKLLYMYWNISQISKRQQDINYIYSKFNKNKLEQFAKKILGKN